MFSYQRDYRNIQKHNHYTYVNIGIHIFTYFRIGENQELTLANFVLPYFQHCLEPDNFFLSSKFFVPVAVFYSEGPGSKLIYISDFFRNSVCSVLLLTPHCLLYLHAKLQMLEQKIGNIYRWRFLFLFLDRQSTFIAINTYINGKSSIQYTQSTI